MTVLDITSVKKNFGPRRVLTDITLSVGEGEVVALLGGNGAGKTTLFNILSRLLEPDGGTITVGGESIDLLELSPRQLWPLGIGRMFQHPQLCRDLTVRENVQRGLGSSGVDDPDVRADEVLQQLRIAHLAETFPEAIDNFAVRVTELATLLAARPRLILLDEPTAGFHEEEADRFSNMVLEHLEMHGGAAMVIEHRKRFIAKTCKRGLCLEGGAIAFDGDATAAWQRFGHAAAAGSRRSSASVASGRGMPALRLRNLSVDYGRGSVVRSASLEVPFGGGVIVVGPNGAGKSSLGRAVAGVTPPSNGTVEFLTPDGNETLRNPTVKEAADWGVSRVPSEDSTYPSLTVGEHLALTLGLPPSALRTVKEKGELGLPTSLKDLENAAAGTLSGGERRLLGLWCGSLRARRRRGGGTATGAVLVLDEPTSGLSPESLESLLEEVSSLLADPNVSLLILEQGADRAYLFGVPVRVMEHGRILAARDRPEDDALAERA